MPLTGDFGVTFAPSGEQRPEDAGAGPPSSLGQAIQILSLRLPKVFGAQAPAPRELLTAPGAAGIGATSPIIETILRALFGGGGAGGGIGGGAGLGGGGISPLRQALAALGGGAPGRTMPTLEPLLPSMPPTALSNIGAGAGFGREMGLGDIFGPTGPELRGPDVTTPSFDFADVPTMDNIFS